MDEVDEVGERKYPDWRVLPKRCLSAAMLVPAALATLLCAGLRSATGSKHLAQKPHALLFA